MDTSKQPLGTVELVATDDTTLEEMADVSKGDDEEMFSDSWSSLDSSHTGPLESTRIEEDEECKLEHINSR